MVIGRGDFDTTRAPGDLMYDKTLTDWDLDAFVSAHTSQRRFRILGVHAQILDPALGEHIRREATVA
jgi:hypothetical protein